MKERIISGIGIAAVGVPILIFAEYIIYPIFLGIISVIAAWELLRVLGYHRTWKVALPSYLICGTLPVLAHRSIFPRELHKEYILFVAVTVFAYLLYLMAVSVFERERRFRSKPEVARETMRIGDVATVFMCITYVSVSFSAMSLMRYIENGEYVFVLIFVAAWTCDIFAYFTGRLFGKHKLAPRLSPKKTIEGSIGGMLFAILGCLLYGFIIEKATGLSASYVTLGAIGLILSTFSQIGDLFASLIKREYGVKDYSRMMPGHGGIMDRFDSSLAITTALLAICMIASPFS